LLDRFDSVGFEIEAKMDSFAAVLTMLSRSSMYTLSVVNKKKVTNVVNCVNDYPYFFISAG
jgi:hypothetical protein